MKGLSPQRVGNDTVGGLIMWPALHVAQVAALGYAYSLRSDPEAVSVALCRLLLLLVLETGAGLLFARAFRSDPGYLDTLEELSCLEVTRAGSSARWCELCSLHQPIRARHCHHCGRCVARYDHHCHFLSTCIGQDNYARFFTFIVYETVLNAGATVALMMSTTQLQVGKLPPFPQYVRALCSYLCIGFGICRACACTF